MPTKNFVPRADGEGTIGTALKRWFKGFFNGLELAGNGYFKPQTAPGVSSAITLDFAGGNIIETTLDQNITTINLQGAQAGSVCHWIVTQGPGGFTLDGLPSGVVGDLPAMPGTDGAVLWVTFYLMSDGVTWLVRGSV